MVDMAHIAGLVAAGLHPSPIPYAHVVTTTTHKTLRGPRGGMILSSQEIADKYNFNKAIFPGTQGGPLMHVIAAKAVCFKEALQPEFKVYQQNIVDNAQALCKGLMSRGIKIVSGGTDNHLMLVDLTNYDITGKTLEKLLDSVNITCNRNTIPNDPKSPFVTSGVRLGNSCCDIPWHEHRRYGPDRRGNRHDDQRGRERCSEGKRDCESSDREVPVEIRKEEKKSRMGLPCGSLICIM